jgi:signal transduction histidine kinase/ActR/RegA family two-component response regulator
MPFTFDNGDKSFSSHGPLVIILSVMLALMGLVFVIYYVDLYRSSPPDLKKWSRLTLIGAIFFGILPTVVYATRLTIVIPGCGFFPISFGSIILTTAFVIQPKLRDVLIDASRNIMIQMRKKLEDQIIEKEEQYQSLFVLMSKGLALMSEGLAVNEVMIDHNGEAIDFIIKSVNPAYESLFKTTKNKVIGVKGSELYKEKVETIVKCYNQAKEKKKPQIFELHFENLKKIFMVSLFSLPTEGEFAVIFMDVTIQRLKAEEQIKSDKIKSIGELAGGLAHDFNNMLTSIMGNVQLAKYIIPEGDEILAYLDDIEEASLQGKDLANHFLTFAKGGAPIKTTIKIGKLLQDSARISLIGSNITYKFQVLDEIWLIDCDAGQIQQVFNNLIINAKEAMPDGGQIVISATNFNVTHDADLPLKEGKYVKIVIKDSGEGIAQENLQKIFDPFYSTKVRVDRKSMGLGLTTSYSIIRRHNGYINVLSQIGVGSTFEIFLPASEKLFIDTDDNKAPIVSGHGKILLMDDDKQIRTVAKKLLTRLGYNIEVVESGELVIERYLASKKNNQFYDVIILDLTVRGGLGGLETLKKLKQLDPEIKVIVTSGYSNDPVLSNFQNYGFIGKIEKPFVIETMSRVISEIINQQ